MTIYSTLIAKVHEIDLRPHRLTLQVCTDHTYPPVLHITRSRAIDILEYAKRAGYEESLLALHGPTGLNGKACGQQIPDSFADQGGGVSVNVAVDLQIRTHVIHMSDVQVHFGGKSNARLSIHICMLLFAGSNADSLKIVLSQLKNAGTRPHTYW